MFNPLKHGALQISLVSTKKPTNDDAPAPEIVTVDPDQLAKTVTDSAVKVIGAIGIAFAANQVLKSVLEVTVHVAKAKL